MSAKTTPSLMDELPSRKKARVARISFQKKARVGGWGVT